MNESNSTEKSEVIYTDSRNESELPTNDKGLTPLMQQFFEIKSRHPGAILLFRCGDFYETFFEDAIVASKELSITLTARGRHKGDPIPLAGVPHHSISTYIAKLINKGFTVAICEQLEDPKQSKGIVKRDVVKIITPGTLSDPQFLDENANNYLVSISFKSGKYFLAAVELSTGELLTTAGDSDEIRLLPDEFTRLNPREMLVFEGCESELTEPPPWSHLKIEKHYRKISESDAISTLCEIFPGEHKARFLAMSPIELKTLGILGDFLIETQKCSLNHLRLPAPYKLGDGMVLDEATLKNLELLPEGRQSGLGGTLFDNLNRTKTSMGARLLKRWLTKPLIKIDAILERQSRVRFLFENSLLLAEIRNVLDRMPDIERILSKIVLGGRNPRDFLAMGQGLSKLPGLRDLLNQTTFSDLMNGLNVPEELWKELLRTLNENPPVNISDGGVIASGISSDLDDLRRMMTDGDSWLKNYEEKERERTGIKTLKVRKNNVFGYFIEISKGVADRAPSDYTRKQTLTTGERFITAELKDYETRAFSAIERSILLEKEIFEKLAEKIRENIRSIQLAATKIAELDTLCSLGQTAMERRYIKPEIVSEVTLEIKGGRHPVVEAFLGPGQFIPNDLILDSNRKQAIITGPNMAGKSTFLRQNALIILLAQIGSFVPAESAKIGIVDRIFTRVGASDNLIRGQSTFMVEMMETAIILKNSTEKSFLILDEIGRGTSTFDGLALAWAILEYISSKFKARLLFATHYHELTDLSNIHKTMFNLNVAVAHDEKNETLVFLHKIQEGAANKSYGIDVARLAGVPRKVIDRAREILFDIEKREENEISRATRLPAKNSKPVPLQLSLFSPNEEIIDIILGTNLDETTPLQALNLLSRLKSMANE
ncbi:MAG: DNA mismatch repair protein MutS [Candidatus Riflebacteria bacterium]|nr:DNA mismatch repair protein MutS [Candidatus Riflebacteria bacterium]